MSAALGASHLQVPRLLHGCSGPDGPSRHFTTPTMQVRLTRLLSVALALVLVSSASATFAQAHVRHAGEHVVRASTVSVANLPDAMLEEHDIPALPNTAVLNVTVQRRVDDALRNVPAELDVTARNLGGIETSVKMRAMVADGQLSYVGAYRFLSSEALDFRISARPDDREREVVLEFRDRLGRR